MRERLASVLSWFAYFHLCMVLLALWASEKNIPESDLSWLAAYFNFWHDVLPDAITIAMPVLIWVLLYITTGRARFFPWVK